VTRHTFHLGTFAAAGLAAVAVAGCGDSNDTSKGGGTASTKNVSGSLSIVGVWTGDEQKSFQAVLDGFKAKFPDIGVRYDPAGDNVPTVLGTAVEGGRPPDLATVAQPGVVAEFQKKGALKSLDFAKPTISDNYPADFVKLGTIGDKLYSFVFKGANKSTVWFNVSAFKNAGVSPPKTWPEFLKSAKTLKASGVPA
jgi:alpha-glucoside transport system substrate-binding protein